MIIIKSHPQQQEPCKVRRQSNKKSERFSETIQNSISMQIHCLTFEKEQFQPFRRALISILLVPQSPLRNWMDVFLMHNRLKGESDSDWQLHFQSTVLIYSPAAVQHLMNYHPPLGWTTRSPGLEVTWAPFFWTVQPKRKKMKSVAQPHGVIRGRGHPLKNRSLL